MKKVLYILILINLIFLSINLSYILKTEPETIIETASVTEETGNIYLSQEDQTWALNTTRETINQYLTDETTYQPQNIPTVFTEQTKKIFISLYNLETHELRACQSGNSLTEAAINTTKDGRFDNLDLDEMANILIVINILNPETEVKDTDEWSDITLGINGLILKQGEETKATFLPGVAISHNYDRSTLVENLCEKANLEEDCNTDSENKFYKFTAFTFMEDELKGSIELYRYNVYTDDLDRENIETMLSTAGDWLEGKMEENGKFKYEYSPSEDDYTTDYNLLRHIGSTYSLLLLYEYYGNEKYLESGKKGIDYFMTYAVAENEMLYIEDDGEAKLGGAALAIIALEKYHEITGDENSLDLAEKFGKFILIMQKDDGGFKNYYPEEKTEEKEAYEVYSAEANLALTRLYEATGGTEYLSALQKSYAYTKNYFDSTPATMMISWDIAAFSELYYLTNNENYADLAYAMADWIIEQQYTEESAPYQDYIGAYSNLRGTPTYSEGIGDAIKLAKYQGDDNRKETYKTALKLSLQYIYNTQYREDNSFYLENPDEAIGGFKANVYENSQRIDQSQHSVSAIIKAVENYVY
ncbi:MAG: AMMECR1 domain-containing protein [Candidatus Gracilibacteria bacterium]